MAKEPTFQVLTKRWLVTAGWSSPREWVLRRWLFRARWHGFCGSVRVAGFWVAAHRRSSFAVGHRFREVGLDQPATARPIEVEQRDAGNWIQGRN
jgi:hypothetical protein